MTLADTVLVDFERHVRAAKTAKKVDAPAKPQGVVPPPADPAELDAAKEQILAVVREELDWDGKGAGDPNQSVAALEDSLADMFDADVEITWDGDSKFMMAVEGEEPILLTPDYLGDLLESLVRGADADADADDESTGGTRGSVVDKHGNFHAAEGADGGRFVPKSGTGVAKAAATAIKKSATATPGSVGGDGSPGGPSTPRSAAKLAARAQGRSGPRATSKAVSGALSASTGQRVRVSGNPDGSFNVGAEKKKMSGKKVAAILIASWLAFAAGSAFLATLAPPAAPLIGTVAAGAYVTLLTKMLRER